MTELRNSVQGVKEEYPYFVFEYQGYTIKLQFGHLKRSRFGAKAFRELYLADASNYRGLVQYQSWPRKLKNEKRHWFTEKMISFDHAETNLQYLLRVVKDIMQRIDEVIIAKNSEKEYFDNFLRV